MPRIARIVVAGYPHHVIHRGNNREDIFTDYSDYKKYLFFLKYYSIECCCQIIAYCLMPNHVHLLLVPHENDTLSKIMQKLTLCYTQYYNKKLDRIGRLWESRYYSSVVDKDQYFTAVIRYIELNPMKANLSSTMDKYRWSSAQWRIHNSNPDNIPLSKPFTADSIGDPPNELDDYYNFDAATVRGRPIGSIDFVLRVGKEHNIDLGPKRRGRPSKK